METQTWAENFQLLAWFLLILISVLVGMYFLMKKKFIEQIGEYHSISDAIAKLNKNHNQIEVEISKAQDYLKEIEVNITQAQNDFNKIDYETKELQKLRENVDEMKEQLVFSSHQLEVVAEEKASKEAKLDSLKNEIHEMLSKIDLYARVEEFVDHGIFEEPQYIFETSARFSEEIKFLREEQKEMIKKKDAITYPESVEISSNKTQNKKILDGQIKLMLKAFNIECDLLIEKVKPSNYPRTLERIEKLANTLEKSAATLHCGFNLDYVALKFKECTLQYQFKLKKQEEQEEQALIREQMREEQKAIREYERAIAKAEKEERMYFEMLKKAREELETASDEERALAKDRIAYLEQQLAEAEANEQRAKSMAEQTKRGHVYIISNIGSFGENIYKIGLTRRLEPLDRVKELGGASVPFTFDVHAMIYSDDAPSLETALHRHFYGQRVNAVNSRKEFFRVNLDDIKKAAQNLTDNDIEFKMTAVAEQYYETLRLQTMKGGSA